MKPSGLDLTTIPDDTLDQDALWKLWQPSVWDGYVVNDSLPVGNQESIPIIEQHKPKCECGAHRTYGDDCMDSMHSSWCVLYKERL